MAQKGVTVSAHCLHGSGAENQLCFPMVVSAFWIGKETAEIWCFQYRLQNTETWAIYWGLKVQYRCLSSGCILGRAWIQFQCAVPVCAVAIRIFLEVLLSALVIK